MKGFRGEELFDRSLLVNEEGGYTFTETDYSGNIIYESKFEYDEYDEAIIEFSVRSGYRVTDQQLKGSREDYDLYKGKKTEKKRRLKAK